MKTCLPVAALFLAAPILAACLPAESVETTSASAPQSIAYRDQVTLQVGQSAVIHGLRGETCGTLPSAARVAQATSDLNAQTDLGTFSFGAEGVRRSGSCSGLTPARQTIFTATTPGQATVRVHGDPVRITVR